MGIIMKGVEQKTNALGVGLGYAHKGCHLAVGYDGHTAVAAVLAQVVGRQVVVEVELCVGRGALQNTRPLTVGTDRERAPPVPSLWRGTYLMLLCMK